MENKMEATVMGFIGFRVTKQGEEIMENKMEATRMGLSRTLLVPLIGEIWSLIVGL